MEKKIAVIRGDGIGPEIVDAAVVCLDAVAQKYKHTFHYAYTLMGGCAIDAVGTPLPQETIDTCLHSDAVLLGAVGGPKWDSLPGDKRPEKGLLGIRSALNLYANVRPALLYPQLQKDSPLKPSITEKGIDLVVVRELIGGIYFGPRGYTAGKKDEAYDTEIYSVQEIERIARVAFDMARTRRKVVTSVDKANVLETSRLWRATVEKVAADYPDVTLRHILVDNCAMQLVKNPSQFDVLLCPNMFGDILSDEAAMITGSIGLLPSSSLGAGTLGLYEPIHGSAPDIAGTDTANPIATVLAAAMMLRSSFNMHKEAKAIEDAIGAVLEQGYRTADIYAEGNTRVGCAQMGKLIAKQISDN